MTNIGPVSNGKLEASKTITTAVSDEFSLRGKSIRVDSDGFVSLNDIHRAAGFKTTKRPYDWQRNPSTNPLIIATYERVTGKSRRGYRMSDVYKPTAEGTWAHPILAAAGLRGQRRAALAMRPHGEALRPRHAQSGSA